MFPVAGFGWIWKGRSDDEDRIVGGKKAWYNIPWQVSVRSCNDGQCHFCGGTILDQWTILSAAHCFPNGVTGISVRAGHRNRLINANWVQVRKCSMLHTVWYSILRPVVAKSQKNFRLHLWENGFFNFDVAKEYVFDRESYLVL